MAISSFALLKHFIALLYCTDVICKNIFRLPVLIGPVFSALMLLQSGEQVHLFGVILGTKKKHPLLIHKYGMTRT